MWRRRRMRLSTGWRNSTSGHGGTSSSSRHGCSSSSTRSAALRRRTSRCTTSNNTAGRTASSPRCGSYRCPSSWGMATGWRHAIRGRARRRRAISATRWSSSSSPTGRRWAASSRRWWRCGMRLRWHDARCRRLHVRQRRAQTQRKRWSIGMICCAQESNQE